MSGDRKLNEWLRELETFLRQTETPPPETVSRQVLRHVRDDLEPRPRTVAAKLFGLHVVAAGIVVLFCPQLGVGPIVGGHGIMALFMRFGPLACAAACGALFLGTSALLATLLLRREELRLANRHGILGISFLVALSFAGLMLAGGESDRLDYAFWTLGAVVAGRLVLRLGAAIRLRPPGSFAPLA